MAGERFFEIPVERAVNKLGIGWPFLKQRMPDDVNVKWPHEKISSRKYKSYSFKLHIKSNTTIVSGRNYLTYREYTLLRDDIKHHINVSISHISFNKLIQTAQFSLLNC